MESTLLCQLTKAQYAGYIYAARFQVLDARYRPSICIAGIDAAAAVAALQERLRRPRRLPPTRPRVAAPPARRTRRHLADHPP